MALGDLAPWRACAACPVRTRCREGIHAVRLTYDGVLRTCMDRPDIGIAMLRVLRAEGPGRAAELWRRWIAESLRCA